MTRCLSATSGMVTRPISMRIDGLSLRLNLVDGEGRDVKPVAWGDNYVTLWPELRPLI